MSQLKFKIGDYITVAEPNDPSHFKRFHKVVGILPGWEEYGEIPYSTLSLQTGRIISPHVYQENLDSIRHDFYMFKKTIIVKEDESNLVWFEANYRVLTEQEKLIYIHE